MNKTKPQTQRRSIDLGVLVTVDEERIILDKAKALGMNLPRYVGGTGLLDVTTQSSSRQNFAILNVEKTKQDFGKLDIITGQTSTSLINSLQNVKTNQKYFNNLKTDTMLKSGIMPKTDTMLKIDTMLKKPTELKQVQTLKLADPFGLSFQRPRPPRFTGGFGFTPFGGLNLPRLPSFKKPKSKAQKGKQRTQYQPSFTASALNIRAVKVPTIAGISVRPLISSKKGKSKRNPKSVKKKAKVKRRRGNIFDFGI